MDSTIKVVSFNLKRDSRFGRLNRWNDRRKLVTQTIWESGASVLGVQELMPAMKEDLLADLNGFSFLGSGRTHNQSGEHSAIILRNSDFEVLYFDTFWLSKHPAKSGSRAYFSPFPRICTVCEAFYAPWGRSIRVFNTHFCHINASARILSVRVILDYMHQLNQKEQMPTILMGDMNACPTSMPIRILSENRHNYDDIHLRTVFFGVHEGDCGNTFHGFKGGLQGAMIDYIFVSEEFEVVKAYVDTSCNNGHYASDHYPLVAELKLKDTQSQS